jgi:hypothetical protein
MDGGDCWWQPDVGDDSLQYVGATRARRAPVGDPSGVPGLLGHATVRDD